MKLDPELEGRISRLWGRRVQEACFVDRGYTPAGRYLLQAPDGSRAFAKVANRPDVAGWLRREAWVYEALAPASYLPEVLGFEDHPDSPILLLESLEDAHWPPPWTRARAEAVRQVLDDLHALPYPQDPDPRPPLVLPGWSEIAKDPAPFLKLGISDLRWLEDNLSTLEKAAWKVELAGETPSHLDVRSDNLCWRGERVLLIDWNHFQGASPGVDLGFWLPSLWAEGGPPPWHMLEDGAGFAAKASGFFAERAGGPFLPHAPKVREIQFTQTVPALAWACRELGIPEPQGERYLALRGRLTG